MIGVRKPGADEAILGGTVIGVRRLPWRVVMLFLDGVGVEAFVSKVAAGDLPVLYCPVPTCESRLHGHGGYERYLGDVLCRVFRVRCPPCGVTHAVLPGNVCAYRDMTLETLEEVVEAGSPSKGESHLDPPPVDGRRVSRRALRAFDRQMRAVVGLLPGVPGGVLDKLRTMFGAQPGVLVRLRRWLLLARGLWFSGLSGLWRHGRPPHVVRRSTNKPW